MGCGWNMPGNYSEGFSTCQGDSTLPMGIDINNGVTKTFHQGDSSTPSAHPAGKSSECTYYSTLSNYGSSAPTPSGSLIKGSTVVSSSTATPSGASSSGTSKSTITTKPTGSSTSTGGSSTGAQSKSAGAAAAVPLIFEKATFGAFVGAAMLFGVMFVLVL